MFRQTQIFLSLVGVVLSGVSFSACSRSGPARVSSQSLLSPANASTVRPDTADADLAGRLKTLCNSIDAEIGVAVIHVESGRMADVNGAKHLPLFSVYKLPLAITVLKEVEEQRLSLAKKVRVTPDDVAPGSQFNADLWQKPVEKTVGELLEFSIVRSDNTSSDLLLKLIGGPGVVTERMRGFGFSNIDIKYSSREVAAHRDKPNTGSASDFAQLLVKLQQGKLLQDQQQSLLLGFMERARTGGERRIRANLPAGVEFHHGDIAQPEPGPDGRGPHGHRHRPRAARASGRRGRRGGGSARGSGASLRIRPWSA